MKKVLVLGGTGAMGVYLVPELLKMGYAVDVVSLDDIISDTPNLTYLKMNALDNEALKELLKNEYFAVVDFLIYINTTKTFGARMQLFLDNTEHYIYLSSYRIYANEEQPIKETSPRLLDVATNPDFLAIKETEYSLYKAIGEDMLRKSGKTNWTVVRPAITYSKYRYQLVTLEAPVLIRRMREGKTVLLPERAMNVQATMSWGGDVAVMIARLIGNKDAFSESFTVATAEHHTWQEVAEIYKKIGGLTYRFIDTEDYLDVYAQGADWARWQLEYDRLFERVIDNSKILTVAGMKQSELMPLCDGLKMELSNLPKDFEWQYDATNDRMDAYLKGMK